MLSSSLAWLKRATGSWAPIWLSPIVLRALATAAYCRFASIEPGERLLARARSA